MTTIATPWADNIQLGDGWHWYVWGGGGNDTIRGGDDGNELHGEDGDDRLLGGAGSDVLYGDAGHDTLLGGAGFDDLNGGAGNDVLQGGDGNDALRGGSGNDRLFGGKGTDNLTGGSGTDSFAFLSLQENPDHYHSDSNDVLRDRILDFARGADRIDISAIDADPTRAGNQAFRFGGEDVSADMGEVSLLRAWDSFSSQHGWEITIRQAGDYAADRMHIFVAGTEALSAADFIL